jgi:NAD(P)-dependent dehydrogenase (short-subunit alcohol dehydrogenase family)
LIAGAASGIGRAAALLLAQHGAVVSCADLDAVGAAATAETAAKEGGLANALHLDVTSEPGWEAAIEDILRRHAHLDVLVNCAGVSFASPVTETKIEDWRRIMAVNVEGVFLGTKHAIMAMRRGGKGGSIIHVSSASGIKASAGASLYSASKAAVGMFTKAIAKECVERNDSIRVNCVSPSGVKTPMWRSMSFFQELVHKSGSEEAAFHTMAEKLLERRFADPEEIAAAILYLASDESRFVTGTELVIDGGYTL